MRKISTKERISLIIALIFFFTTLTVNIKNFKKDIKYIASTEVNNKYNTKQNNHKEEDYNVKDHISNLWHTLGESIDYLKGNIDNKEKAKEIKILIDDSITALNSIEDALNKNYKDTSSDFILYTRDMRNGFANLKEILEKDNVSKEEILKDIKQNYIKGKTSQKLD
ncbi:hypothetical protein B2H91_08065 [Clostridium botulinum]|uniref:hypothetical protein n=1 Tax=Clostridium botulinum TaxID=1491 RepID=UPI000A1739BA|nr:hypothetical protein [Clostridium botulinum]AUN18577.1 hypothetical protein B2M06_13600 [Clostridium botulinum]OSA85955.1 hypothetical protein B2H91_08065 [Clostridium botulinum]